MIGMKIDFNNDKTIIYLYQDKLDFDNIDKLNKEIKDIFIKLIKIYHLDFFGYFKVHIYENKKYGCILEIEKKFGNEFNIDIIDLKLVIHKDSPFYLEMNDYLFDYKIDNLQVINNKYYVNIDDLDNLNKYIEYGKIIYKKESLKKK